MNDNAEKLWDLANLIAGFGVLQAIATIFAIAKGELKGIRGFPAHRWVVIGTAAFTLFYIFAIGVCGCLGVGLDKSVNLTMWMSTMAVSVLFFFLIFLSALLCGLVGLMRWTERDCLEGPILATTMRVI